MGGCEGGHYEEADNSINNNETEKCGFEVSDTVQQTIKENLENAKEWSRIDDILDSINTSGDEYNIGRLQGDYNRGKQVVGVYDADGFLFNIESSQERIPNGEITEADIQLALDNFNNTNGEVQILTSLNSMQENESNDNYARRMHSTSILNKIANGFRNSLGQELSIGEPIIIEGNYEKIGEIIGIYNINGEHLFNIQSSDKEFGGRITQDDMKNAVDDYKNSIEGLSNDPQSILESGNYTAEDIFNNNKELFDYIHNYLINGNIDVNIVENLFKIFKEYASDNDIILTNDAVIDPKFNDGNKVFSIESKYILNVDVVYGNGDRSDPIDFTFG